MVILIPLLQVRKQRLKDVKGEGRTMILRSSENFLVSFTQHRGSFDEPQGRAPWVCEPSSEYQRCCPRCPATTGTLQVYHVSPDDEVTRRGYQRSLYKPPNQTQQQQQQQKCQHTGGKTLAAKETDPRASKKPIRVKTQEVSCKRQEMNTAAIWDRCAPARMLE